MGLIVNLEDDTVTVLELDDVEIRIQTIMDTIPQGTGNTPPLTATSPGIAGSVAWDSSFIYICLEADTWMRSPLSTW